MCVRAVLAKSPAALAAVLWFASTFFFFGDTGRLGDDYTVAMRDPATGAIDLGNHPWVRWPYFWRPIHLAHASAINTISWDRPWIGHLELALVHALVAWMLMRFLVRLGVLPRIASLTALLFLACPLVSGGVLWTTASCNAMSCVLLLLTFELVRRQAISAHSSVRVAWIAILSFVTACWYEPGAAALAAVPVVYLAASQGAGAAAKRLRGACVCAAAAGLSCALYAGLLVATAPPNARGAGRSFVTAANVLPRARHFSAEVASAIAGRRAEDLFAGGLEQGWWALHSPTGWAVAALAVILACLAFIAMVGAGGPAVPESAPRTSRGLLALVGLTVFVAAWLPILAVPTQTVALRSLYVPVLGLAIAAAGLANGVARALARAPARTGAVCGLLSVGVALLAALVFSTVAVGVQSQLRLNSRRDESIVKQLHELVPEPATGTVFLPLRIDAPAAFPGRYCHDYAIHSAFEAPWSCDAVVRAAYRRNDVSSTPTPKVFRRPRPDGFRLAHNAGIIAWARCVPFRLDEAGAVHLVPRLTVVPTGSAPFDVEFPLVPAPAPRADLPMVRLREDGAGYCEVQDAAAR